MSVVMVAVVVIVSIVLCFHESGCSSVFGVVVVSVIVSGALCKSCVWL